MKFKFLFSILPLILFELHAQPTNLLEEARLLERQFKTMDAIRKYEMALVSMPNNVPVLVRLTELYCMEGNSNPNESKSLYALANQFATRAFEVDSNRADVHYAKALVLGRLIQHASIKEKTSLTVQILEQVEIALKIDSLFTKAIYTLAKWHDEVSSLNPAARAALKFMQKGFPPASAEDAIALYEKARKLDPGFMPNNLDLAMAYKRQGKSDKAIELLKFQIKLPMKTKEDQEIKLKSKQLLESLQ